MPSRLYKEHEFFFFSDDADALKKHPFTHCRMELGLQGGHEEKDFWLGLCMVVSTLYIVSGLRGIH